MLSPPLAAINDVLNNWSEQLRGSAEPLGVLILVGSTLLYLTIRDEGWAKKQARKIGIGLVVLGGAGAIVVFLLGLGGELGSSLTATN